MLLELCLELLSCRSVTCRDQEKEHCRPRTGSLRWSWWATPAWARRPCCARSARAASNRPQSLLWVRRKTLPSYCVHADRKARKKQVVLKGLRRVSVCWRAPTVRWETSRHMKGLEESHCTSGSRGAHCTADYVAPREFLSRPSGFHLLQLSPRPAAARGNVGVAPQDLRPLVARYV